MKNRLLQICALVFALPVLAYAQDAPSPLLKAGQPVSWWFVFKFNAQTFPACGGGDQRVCLFDRNRDPEAYAKFGQQFVYASDAERALKKGTGCAGDSVNDPLGATFDEIYRGAYYYVLWNDQFYDDPKISGCTQSCSGPWGHSKGMLAWDDSGNGVVLQVTTPSWPASGSAQHPRSKDGNTLGCVTDNDVLVSQHFFSLKLTKSDVIAVLQALANASVVTNQVAKDSDGKNQIVRNGGPSEISALVDTLGVKSASTSATKVTLSSGVILISKPSKLAVPPWQLVSSELGSVPLRAATWWASPAIYSTTDKTAIHCWSASLAKPGAVAIATSGKWDNVSFGLMGGLGANRNHAKVGVSADGRYTIFGDMNQQGNATGKGSCASSQNGRGGLFYVIDDPTLAASVGQLIAGSTAPTKAPAKTPAKP